VIARLTGRRVAVDGGAVVVDVAGVGYLVHASASVLRLGEELTVETYMHVREDTLQLYGFASAEERELFVHLLSVNGVGPKVALAIVSGSTPAELRRAIALEDTARFEAIPGIGKKTAQRVVLELKEKLGALEPIRAPGGGAGVALQAREALIELGYALLDAERALEDIDPGLPVEEQVRQALRRAA
jgi:holliday junction DNA helicase RuvA